MSYKHRKVGSGTHIRRLWMPAILLVLLCSNQVQACSCTPSGPPCQAFWQTDAVFLGTVKAKTIVTIEVDNETKRTAQQMSVRFLVDDVYRGLLGGNDVEVITGMGSAECGYNFEKGKRYLVYANEFQNKLRTGICSRTSLLTVRHLPPGKYKLKSGIPETSGNQWQMEVTVADRACTEVEFSSNVEAATDLQRPKTEALNTVVKRE